ncbi:3727_t:CDS:2, partial [Gigaspora rosea]
VEKDTLNLGLVEEAGLRKKHKMDQSRIVEQVFSENNLYIDKVGKDSGNKITKENGDDSMENECLSQPEESNLEDLIEAEKNANKID